MHGTSKTDPEALWWRNRAMRKKALGLKLLREELKHLPPELRHRPLSPQEFRSLPPQLRRPDKLHGFPRPKGLRGPVLVKYLMHLGVFWPDRRWDDCINALLEHGIVDPGTHKFTDRQGAEIDRDNEYQQARCLNAVCARYEQVGSLRRASLEIAAEWGLPGPSLETVAKGLRDQLRPPKK